MKRVSVTDAVDLVKVGPGYMTLFGALCVSPLACMAAAEHQPGLLARSLFSH